MGAYLYFKTDCNPDEVTKYLFEKNEQNLFLQKHDEQTVWLCDTEHLDWVKEERPDMYQQEAKKFGKGDIKTSGGPQGKPFIDAGYGEEDLLEMWTQIFEELNKRFKMKYYAGSCAFGEKEYYFSLEQMKRITRNGELLSGKSSKSERGREKYDLLYPLLSEPETNKHKLSDIKAQDELLMDDGKVYQVVEGHWDDSLKLNFVSRGEYSGQNVEEVVEHIRDNNKYIPKIRYEGATADIEGYVLDSGALIYLEIIGVESMVKSITSVLMQGRTKMNDHTVDASFGYFSVNKGGNKRKMTTLENGLAHAIVYHSPSIADTNFSVLVGEDDEALSKAFLSWLEKSQPLPFPKELSDEIYKELGARDKLEELKSNGIKAFKIDLSILEDDYNDLMNVILDVSKRNGLIRSDATPMKKQFPLPQSPILQENQVQKIYDTLNEMPKTYELEDVAIKPIGLKLFSPNMTLYVTEADMGSPDDEFENMHTQCFGYVKNEADPDMSEWGYINIPEYLKAGNPRNYFEQDLYFSDMYIDSHGKVGTLDEFKKIAA